jgi:hypothetical protein
MIDVDVDNKTAQRIRKRPGSFDKFENISVVMKREVLADAGHS